MLAAIAIMLVGIGLVAVASQRGGYRLGGVMVLPLLTIYTLREPLSPVVFAVATVAAWLSLWALREFTLAHGRRVFLVAVVVGALVSILVAFAVARTVLGSFVVADAEVVGSIFPGIAAYNLMRVSPDQRSREVVGMVAAFGLLLGVGVVALSALSAIRTPTPPFLLLPTSEAPGLLGLAVEGTPTMQLVPGWLAVLLLLVDVVVYELIRARYDVRLAGIILIPLTAVFSVQFGATVVLYAVGATVAFFLLSVVHWLTLLYGRNLLAVGLSAGLCFALLVGLVAPMSIPGPTLFFIGLFVGIGAYNLHRVAPPERPANIRLSAGLFVVFYAALLAVVEVPPPGFAADLTPWHVALGVVVFGLGAWELWRLERTKPDAAAFAGDSVFASFTPDGATVSDSPLVTGEE